jgi:hypothetical protein
MTSRARTSQSLVALAVAVLAVMAGCSDDAIVTSPADDARDKAVHAVYQVGDTPPATQAAVSTAAGSLTFWPYTGRSFDGEPVDPINLVFAGQASPLQIRAALMALDGDRSAYGMPPVPPFNQTWQDAIGGDVQTTCAVGGDGWVGSVVQLTLGEFGPLRIHLRLFRTGQLAGGGPVTLGAAHFELHIPGTADHQVLSWEVAEQIVTADLARTGLLGAMPAPTGLINAAPSFRTIPAMIYNGLPPELCALIGGPMPPVAADVPLPSNGQGTVFQLAFPATLVPGVFENEVTVSYDQLVPRPFCSTGPGDWLMVTGPVRFTVRTELLGDGTFASWNSFDGVIEAVPVDLSSGAPVPLGPAFPAHVYGHNHVNLDAQNARVVLQDRRFTHEADGLQVLHVTMNVPQHGQKTYRVAQRCLGDD